MTQTIKYSEVRKHPEKFEIIWQPDALPDEPAAKGKQFAALSMREDIGGWYGGKDSGKSDLLIWDCLKPAKINSQRWLGVIFRREYKRLEEVIARAHHHLGKLPQLKAHWQGSPHFQFKFPSGARLAFHNVEHLGDEEKYQGWEICDLKLDQLEEFLEPQYNYLMLQNRSGDPAIKPTTRWTANPLGVGHQFITKRYVKKFERATTNEISSVVDGVRHVKTFRWIHFTVRDNPVARRDPSRIATLALEPNPTRRAAMLDGDPNVMMGQFFSMFDVDEELIDPFEIPKQWNLTLSIDPGWGGICSAGLHARDFEGVIYRIATYYQEKRNNDENAAGIKEFWQTNKFTNGRQPDLFVAGLDAWAKKDRYAVISSDATFADIFQSHGMILEKAVTDRTNGWGTMKSLMPSRFKVFKHFNNPFIEELISAQTDERDINDIAGRGNDPSVADHALDDCRYNTMATYTPAKKEEKPKGWFEEAMARSSEKKGWSVGDA